MEFEKFKGESCFVGTMMKNIYEPNLHRYKKRSIESTLKRNGILDIGEDICKVRNYEMLDDIGWARHNVVHTHGKFDIMLITDLETDWESERFLTGKRPPLKKIAKGRTISDIITHEVGDKYRPEELYQTDLEVMVCLSDEDLALVKNKCVW